MLEFERLNAIRKMLNVPAGRQMRLSNGEVIQAWDLCDERGNSIGVEEVPPDVILHCYQRHTEWGCPNEHKE